MKDAPILPPNSARLHTLDNGLEVIIAEEQAHPVVSVQLWVKAGSLHEEEWTGAGLAHLVEHMLFKGTAKRGPAQIAQDIQAHGGQVNAYTTLNRTVYYIDGVAENVGSYLEILADMARGSLFDATELAREQEVIRREFAMDNDDPQSVLQHLLQSTAFRQHPMRHPVIGHLVIFNQVGRDDVAGFHARHYVPNNCFVVISGGVDDGEALKAVEKHFGSWERKPYEPVVMPAEPDQTAARIARREFNTDIARLSLGWHIGGESHENKAALDVLAFILGGGRSSRLNLELRERLGIAHWVGASAWSALDRGLFIIEAEADANDLEKVETSIAGVLAEIISNGPKPHELEKAVRATLSHSLRLRSTTKGVASILAGSWLAVGDLDHDRAYLERVQALGVDDIIHVVRKFLAGEKVTRVSLHPPGTLQAPGKNGTSTKRGVVEKIELANGLTLLVRPDGRLPLVSVRAQFLAGVPVETAANAGATQVTAQWLSKGTASHSDEEIAALLEARGGSLSTNGDAHRLAVSADIMRGDEGIALGLISEILLSPTFPAEHLPKIQKRQQAAIREELEDPLTVALRRARAEIFAGLPYQRTALGTAESVAALGIEQCRGLWKQCVQGRNGVISVFGDVDVKSIREQAEKLFGPLAAGERSTAGFTPMSIKARPGRWDLQLDKEQGVLAIGFPTVDLHDASVPALQLIDEACSDMGSRLFNRIREEMGLAYFVGTSAFQALGAGAFYFYVGCDPAKLDVVEEELRKEIADLASNGLRSDELQRAKTTWKASWLRAQQGNAAMADGAGWDELCGFGHGHYLRLPAIMEAVSAAEIQASAARFFADASAFIVRVRGDVGR
ncbi:MAG: pitrilysin family protein [Verrucomicrobiaceae bacterium]